MSRRSKSAVIAAYLLLCLLLGGSSQYPWTTLALQLGGIALIAWAAIAPRLDEEHESSAGPLYLLLLCTLAWVLVQLVPLPPGLWASLPGRAELAVGYENLGYATPSLPISETPYRSLLALFAAIPALAAFVATDRLRAAPRAIAVAIVAGMVAGVFLGAAQVAAGDRNWAHLYSVTNRGAVGFFANHNHMATLLLVSIPVGAALFSSIRSSRSGSNAGRYALGAGLLALVLIGIALNGSRAAYALCIPVLLASSALVPLGNRLKRLLLPASAVALLGAVAVLAANPISEDDPSIPVEPRTAIWAQTQQAIADNFPAGTGLGSFEQVYRHYENPDAVTIRYVNHAHNDFLEIALELGAPGLVLLVLFLAWWAFASARIWRSPSSSNFARAATIATAAMLAHSVVDFPLRTAAMASVFAALIALMTQRSVTTASPRTGEQQTVRHVKLG